MASSSTDSNSKRRDRSEDADIEPSSVLHIGNLASNTLEIDLIRTFLDCGDLKDVVILPSKHQAFMEFENQDGADSAIERSRVENGVLIKGNRVFANYCKDKKINHDGALESVSPNKIILLSVTELVYPIECDTLYRICSPHGRPLRIVIVKKPFIQNVQGMVEFGSVDDAKRAKQNLNGADIYPGCCRLKVTYANQSRLNVQRNDSQHCDYEKTYQLAASTGSSILTPPSKTSILDGPGGVAAACAAITFAGLGHGDPASFDPAMAAVLQAFDPYHSPNRPPSLPGAGAIASGPAYCGPQKRASLGLGGATSAVEVSGPVLLALHIDKDRLTPEHIFNLFCIYGNVLRVKFLKAKDGLMLEYSDTLECERALTALNNIPLSERRITLWPSKREHLALSSNPESVQMDFSNSPHHRFLLSKNVRSISGPRRTLYYYGVPASFDAEALRAVLQKVGAPAPSRIKVLPAEAPKAHGLVEWPTLSDTIQALILANHFELGDGADSPPSSKRRHDDCDLDAEPEAGPRRGHFLYLQFASGGIPSEEQLAAATQRDNKENEAGAAADARIMPPPAAPGALAARRAAKKKARAISLEVTDAAALGAASTSTSNGVGGVGGSGGGSASSPVAVSAPSAVAASVPYGVMLNSVVSSALASAAALQTTVTTSSLPAPLVPMSPIISTQASSVPTSIPGALPPPQFSQSPSVLVNTSFPPPLPQHPLVRVASPTSPLGLVTSQPVILSPTSQAARGLNPFYLQQQQQHQQHHHLQMLQQRMAASQAALGQAARMENGFLRGLPLGGPQMRLPPGFGRGAAFTGELPFQRFGPQRHHYPRQ